MTAGAILLLPAPRTGAHRTPAWLRAGGAGLLAAFAISVAVHVAVTLWPVDRAESPDAEPLKATIVAMPPPPVPAAPSISAKPKPRPRPVSPLVPPPAHEPVADDPPVPAQADPAAPVPESVATEPGAAAAEAPPLPAPVPAPALAQEVARPPVAGARVARVLPPRVDLNYRVYYGPGLHIGDASYRFEHEQNRYKIATLGEARGLAALILRGQGRVETRGLITPDGLQPWELVVERGSRERRETASFDWDTGIATLHEDKTAALELPTFDPLSLMWQFYFSPPAGDEQVFHIVTTRRVARIQVRREGTDIVSWPHGEVEAERWHRRSDDGRTDALVWLAPSLNWLPIKMRVTNTLRGTLEVVLAAIRVDDGERVE